MKIRGLLLTVLGFIFLLMGAIGLLLPIWPTTPFVLVSAACFSCTPHLRAKIMRIKFFREHIENYSERKGLSRKTVAISLIYLWSMLVLSIVWLNTIWITAILFAVGTAVTVHILIMSAGKRKDTSV